LFGNKRSPRLGPLGQHVSVCLHKSALIESSTCAWSPEFGTRQTVQKQCYSMDKSKTHSVTQFRPNNFILTVWNTVDLLGMTLHRGWSFKSLCVFADQITPRRQALKSQKLFCLLCLNWNLTIIERLKKK